jgi:hypothetical protein
MNDSQLEEASTVMPDNADLDLGDGHWLRWTQYEGERTGGILIHRHIHEQTDKALGVDRDFCRGAFWLRGSSFIRKSDSERPQWDLTGTDSASTLSPSFLCHCGDHGWVRDGKWVRA